MSDTTEETTTEAAPAADDLATPEARLAEASRVLESGDDAEATRARSRQREQATATRAREAEELAAMLRWRPRWAARRLR